MKIPIDWEIDLPFDDYPSELKHIYQNKYLSLRKDYSNWIDEISSKFSDNIDWWSLLPSSRNPNFSKMYRYICVIETLREIKRKNIYINLSTRSKEFFRLLQEEKIVNEKFLKINMVNGNNNLDNIFSYFKSFIFQVYIFIFINIFIKRRSNKYEILINTYPNNKLEKPERLFQFSNQFTQKNKKKFAFVPSFIRTRNFFLISRIIFNLRNENYIFREHYLKFSDLIFALNLILRLKVFKTKYKKYKSYDLSNLIISEISNLENFDTSIIGILNYLFVKRLKEANLKIKKVYCWFENHELKGWNYGFRRYFPNIDVVGYQGFTPLSPLMNTIPTRGEAKAKVIPKRCIIISKQYLRNIKEFNKNFRVSIGPSLIYSRIFKKFKKTNKIKFLVVLGEFKNVNNNLLKWINLIVDRHPNISFLIKKPKITNMNDAIKKYDSTHMNFIDNYLPKLFEETQFVITSGLGFSNAAMESLAYECQLLIPIIDPYDKIYLERLGVPNKFFKTFNKKEDFINFFDNFFKIKNKNIKKIAYKKFRNKFFCNNSDKSFFLK